MIYFDNAASTYQKPATVGRAMNEAVQLYSANPGRSGHDLSVAASECVYGCRKAAAELFGVQPDNVIFTLNTTMALNMAVKGLVRKGMHILISDLEHNSVLRPVRALGRQGVTFDVFEVDMEDDAKTVANIRRKIRPNTGMLVVTHISNVTGRVLPVDTLAKISREYGLCFIVDAAQSAGVLDIDLSRQDIDVVCTAGHKSLYGPQGTGLLVLKEERDISTVLEGGTGSDSLLYENPDYLPDRLESGTLNTPGIAGLHAGIDYIRSLGTEHIRNKSKHLTEYAVSALREFKKITLYACGAQTLGVVSFNVSGMPSEAVAASLNKQGVCVRAGLHCSALAHQKLGTQQSGTVRISFSCFNTEAEIDKMVHCLKVL